MTNLPPLRPLSEEQIALLRRVIRPLDCGHHYCRYCDTGTGKGWQHEAGCPYVQSERDVEEAKAILDALLRVSGPREEQSDHNKGCDLFKGRTCNCGAGISQPAAPDAAAHDEPPAIGWRRWAWVDGEGRLSIMKPNATRSDVAELGEPDERLIRVQITEVGRAPDAAEEK